MITALVLVHCNFFIAPLDFTQFKQLCSFLSFLLKRLHYTIFRKYNQNGVFDMANDNMQQH